MTKKTIYICGPITNVPGLNKEEFLLAQMMLKKQGFNAVNPHDLIEGLDLDPIKDYNQILRICIAEMVRVADEVVTLNGALESNGSRKEMNVAREVNIPVHPITKYKIHGHATIES